MSVNLYMDHHVPAAITNGLSVRGVDVLTAIQDGAEEMDDAALLRRATALGRVLFTFDDDLLVEAQACQQMRVSFAGLIYAHELRVTIGMCVNDLELICKVCEANELENQVCHLPI